MPVTFKCPTVRVRAPFDSGFMVINADDGSSPRLRGTQPRGFEGPSPYPEGL